MFAVNGILFNHESERRGENFVTRKITLAAARIAEGLQDHLELGNLDSLRDWGYAKDYVECMWLMLQSEQPEDFVIATGEQHTVRDFTEKAFRVNGMEIRWEGSGVEEKGYDVKTGKMLVCVNPAWFRPTDVDNLLGDPTKAKTVLGWDPRKTSYEELVCIMAEHDRKLAKQDLGLYLIHRPPKPNPRMGLLYQNIPMQMGHMFRLFLQNRPIFQPITVNFRLFRR